MIRRLRGVITTAVVWSLVFALAQAPVAAMLYAFVPAPQRPLLWPLLIAVSTLWAVTGLASGAIFAGVVVWRGRDVPLARLSLPRFTWWGTAAGALTPALVVPVLVAIGLPGGNAATVLALSVVGAALGAGAAGSTLWVAQRSAARAELHSGDEHDV